MLIALSSFHALIIITIRATAFCKFTVNCPTELALYKDFTICFDRLIEYEKYRHIRNMEMMRSSPFHAEALSAAMPLLHWYWYYADDCTNTAYCTLSVLHFTFDTYLYILMTT